MKQLDLLKDSPGKLFFRYLLPSISATLVTSIYILADSVMIGKGVGPNGIAALNIILPIFTLFFGTGLLFGVGGAVLMSIARGSNDYELGRQYFTTSVLAVGGISMLMLLLTQMFLTPILELLGTSEVTHTYAMEYARILSAGAPIFMYSSMLQAFVRNDQDPNLAMIGVIAGGVTNIVLDYVFIYWCSMGMRGGAIATVLGSTVTILILVLHFFKKENGLILVKGGFSLRRFGKIVTNGLSSFLVEMANGIVTCLFNIQIGAYIGDLGITVYSIVANSSFVVMSLANGVAQAAQPIIATNFGAGKKDRVVKVRHLGLLCAAAIGTVIVLLGVTAPTLITKIFVHSTEEILALSIPAIRIYFVSFLFMNLNVFQSNYFQSVMQPQYAMAVSLLRGLILSSAFVMILPIFMGNTGIWSSMIFVEVITFLCTLLFRVKDK